MYTPFKMKGHTLPGIKQVESNKTKEGRAGSSALQKKEGYNPDGSVDKNSERYKKAMAVTKKSDARKAKETELRKTMKTGNDKEARGAKAELMSKGKISMDEKRTRDAENKQRNGGSSPVKLLGRKKRTVKKSTNERGVTEKTVTKTSKADKEGNVKYKSKYKAKQGKKKMTRTTKGKYSEKTGAQVGTSKTKVKRNGETTRYTEEE